MSLSDIHGLLREPLEHTRDVQRTARSYVHFSWARNVMAITKRRFRQVRCQIELIDAAENGLPARHGRENEPLGSRIKWATAVLGMWGVGPAMEDFTFKVNLVAVVRVRAGDESVARKAVPTVLGAPGTVEIGLANENNAATGRHATITDVDFTIGSIKPLGAGS